MASNQADLNTHSKRLIRGISLQQKLTILRQLEAGIPRKEICENLQCCQSTITRILVSKHEILQVAEQDNTHIRQSSGMVTYRDIDEKLSKWAQDMKGRNQLITVNSAKIKAEEIAREMGEEDFIPSVGWLYKWKEREKVQFCKKSKAGEQQHEILKGLLERHEDKGQTFIHKAKKIRSSISESFTDKEHLPGIDKDLQEKTKSIQETRSLMHQDFGRTNNSQEVFSQQDMAKRSYNKNLQPMLSEPTTSGNESDIPVKKNFNIVTDSDASMAALGPSSKIKTKKKFYNYDPVYVLTSSGRYRKEKTFLTLFQKLEILERLKNGEKRTDLINEYRLSQSAMCQIVADEKKIKKMADIGQNLHMKRVRGGIFKAGESELNAWVIDKMDKGEMLTRNEVKIKAKEIADSKNIEFKASTGWLEKWKARMNMDFNRKHVLYRKTRQCVNKSDVLETNAILARERISREEEKEDEDKNNDNSNMLLRQQRTTDKESTSEEADEDEDNNNSNMHLRERLTSDKSTEENNELNMVYTADLDLKPLNNSQEKYYPEVVTIVDKEVETEDLKPIIDRSNPIFRVEDSELDEEQSLHQQIISWLNKYNIAPTAATELLTILHPVISDNPEAPHQTRITITTKPASRSKGKPYAQHKYS